MWLVILLMILLIAIFSQFDQVQNRRNREIYLHAKVLKRKSIRSGALIQSPYSSESDFLTYMGYFFKHKKHEWVFIAFLRNGIVYKFWLNKGVDGDSVASDIGFYEIADICQKGRFNGLLVGHNHPSGALSPSKQDRVYLEEFLNFFDYYNISVTHVVFVAERWKRYGLSIIQKIKRM